MVQGNARRLVPRRSGHLGVDFGGFGKIPERSVGLTVFGIKNAELKQDVRVVGTLKQRFQQMVESRFPFAQSRERQAQLGLRPR